MSVKVYVILDGTHYPIGIYLKKENACLDLANHNKGLTTNLCYLVVSNILDWGETNQW